MGRSLILGVALSASSFAYAQVPAGPTFIVNTDTTGYEVNPRVAPDRDGFVVTWQSMRIPVHDSFAQRFDAAGARVGAEFRMNTGTLAGAPVVAAGKGGDLVGVWVDGIGVVGRLFSAANAPLGPEFQVATYTTGYQSGVDVFRNRDGSFVVTWASDGVDGDGTGVVARRFDGAGNVLGVEFVVNTYTTGNQSAPAVSGDGGGNVTIVWRHSLYPARAIFGQRFDAAGVRLGGEFVVNSSTPDYGARPSIDVSGDGGFVVAWLNGYPTSVRARRFDPNGAPLGAEIAVLGPTLPPPEMGPGAVSSDAAGNFVVVWSRPSFMMFGQRIDASGARRGAQFIVGPPSGTMPRPPVVHGDALGNFIVVREGYGDGSGGAILATRYGGLLPSGLFVVDHTGAGMLEPGQPAAVIPSWTNVNGAAQTFGGTLMTLTGPPGLTYTIPDAGADYGTVPDRSAAACTDCYTVSVGMPGVRPLIHLDAIALERISPDAQGQHKRWTLHIGSSFDDVTPSSPYYRYVETLLHNGVTAGCRSGKPSLFCPEALLTRAQMAPLVLLAKEGPEYTPPACTGTRLFGDVPASNPFCAWVEELARRGIVSGCGLDRYCPNRPITREETAVVLVKTLDPAAVPPPCVPPNVYPDVPETSPFCPWIEALANRGMVAHCGGGNFCPSARTTRGEMAAFVTRTFGLTLYGP